MANDAAITDLFNKPNYIGELFMIGAGRTPFLNMIGGVDGGNMMIAKGWEFPLAQFYSLEAAGQPAITETQAQAAATPTTYVTDQLSNYVQVFKEDVSVSYAKISDMNTLTGLAQMGNDVDRQSAMDFQIAANLRQIALDADHTFLNGTAQKGTNNTTAWKTGGVITALSTNTVAGGAAALTRAMIDELVKKMADAAAPMENPVIFCNSFQKQKLTALYGYAPEDRRMGGTNIVEIETDFSRLPVVFEPQIPAATLAIIDMAYIRPVALPVPEKGILFYEEKESAGAAVKGMIYGQLGVAWAHESFHGKITNLATS